MYRRVDLDNGIRIALNHMPNMESASVGVWIASGSRYEAKRRSGISHFLEHMVFKGTTKRTARMIKQEIEGIGGSLNGFTSEEMACYLAKVSSQHTDVAISVLSDMVINAHLNEKDIEKERSVIIEEIKMYRDLPNHHVHDILSELMWPKHMLGQPIAGNIDSVRSMRRRDLLDHRNTNYVPENIVVVVSGNMDEDDAINNIKKIFNVNAKSHHKNYIRVKITQRSPKVRIVHKDTEQSHLCMAVHSFGRTHKDRYVLSVLHTILGANMSSRLFENVREQKGLAYEIGTEVKRYKETGAFVVNAGIEHKKVRKAVSVILGELRKLKKELVSENELKRAKEFLKVQLLLALEDTLDHMLWLGEHMIALGELPDKDEIINRVTSVTKNDIQRVARDIFNDSKLNLAIIGRLDDKEAKEVEKELKL